VHLSKVFEPHSHEIIEKYRRGEKATNINIPIKMVKMVTPT